MKKLIFFVLFLINFSFIFSMENDPKFIKAKQINLFVKAAENGDLEKVKNFVDAGIDVNSIDDYNPKFSGMLIFSNWTALCSAVCKKQYEVTKYLIDKGADINLCTPIFYATENDDVEFVKFLHEQGAFLDKLDKDNRSLLGASAFEGYENIVKYLLNNGVSVDHLNPNNDPTFIRTPLSWVIVYGDVDDSRINVIKLLIYNGADLDFSYNGKNIFEWAREKYLQEENPDNKKARFEILKLIVMKLGIFESQI